MNLSESVKRRIRDKVYGTVLKTEGLDKWEVCFDYDYACRLVTSRSLKIVPDDVGIPLIEAHTESDNSIHFMIVQ